MRLREIVAALGLRPPEWSWDFDVVVMVDGREREVVRAVMDPLHPGKAVLHLKTSAAFAAAGPGGMGSAPGGVHITAPGHGGSGSTVPLRQSGRQR